MKKIKWSISIGLAGCTREDIIEVDDNATDDEIEEMVREDAFNCIDWGYRIIEEGDETDE